MICKHYFQLVLCIAVTALLVIPTFAHAGGGGGITPGGETAGVQKAQLRGGKAIAPAGAPAEVKRVIAAANEIRNKPYKWGGGHGSWNDSGYDCSGAVSFALRGGRLLDSPLDSGSLARWGRKGKGEWITVYANAGHVYMVVAGLRFDTANTNGDGPSWSKDRYSIPGNFKARHPNGL